MLIKRAGNVVDGGSLAVVRIIFGAVGLLSMIRIVAYGWVESLYAKPPRHFTYPGLRWVQAPSTAGMYVLVAAVAIAACAVTAGYRTRLALVLFLVGFSWIEFIDVTTYLNHYWFVTLVGIVLLAPPIDTAAAVHRRQRVVRRGWIWLLRFHVGLVYSFAGLAKLNDDWLVHALPLRLWLPARSQLPLIGGLLEQTSTAYLLSWAGAVFDCTIVALLCWRRTRLAAWFAVICFHVATWVLFPIGVFPWLMIGVTTVFFDPDWPHVAMARLRRRYPDAAMAPIAAPGYAGPRRTAVALSAAWVLTMLVVPLRHHLIAGDSRWTGEGYRFSWNVLLTEKGADVRFRVVDRATGLTTVETATDLYTPLQWKVMSTEAELIRQAAHAIAAEHQARGESVAVYVDVFVSLNGRQPARLIDPTIDLSREPYRLGQSWILPAPTTPAP